MSANAIFGLLWVLLVVGMLWMHLGHGGHGRHGGGCGVGHGGGHRSRDGGQDGEGGGQQETADSTGSLLSSQPVRPTASLPLDGDIAATDEHHDHSAG